MSGKYSKLLRVLEVEPNYLGYGDFNDCGQYETCSYRGYEAVPARHWVYVYPNWYIWGEGKP